MYLGLAIAVLLVARTASATCAAPRGSMTTVSLQVVFLGRYEDLAGHAASVFFDPARKVVVGPVDHGVWPGTQTKAAALPAGLAPGATGKLTLRGWVDDPKHPTASAGFFEAFKADNGHADLGPITAQLTDWFVIGLLAGKSPVEAPAAARFAGLAVQQPEDRARAALAAQGILIAAPLARAQQLLASYVYRDIAGARLDRVATFVRGGLKALATLAPEPAKFDWTDYLPELATAWAAHPGPLRDVLDDLVLGHFAPALPPVPDQGMAYPYRCGPSRTELRGPFTGPGELSGTTILDALHATDHKFGDAVADAFAGLSAGTEQLVVAIRTIDRRNIAFVAGRGTDSIAAIEVTAKQAATLAIGAKLRYVAHPAPKLSPPLLDPDAVVIGFGGAVTRLDVGAVDVPALLATLKGEATSAHLGYAAGHVMAALFELADHVPGWTRADAHAYLASAPGNVYSEPWQWGQAWSEILEWAIRLAPDAAVAGEIERALPAIIANFARGTKQALPAEVVRNFAIDVAVHVAARQILANDLVAAQRVLTLAGGPLAVLAGNAPVAPESTRDANHALELSTMQALVSAIRHQPVTLPPARDREHGLLLVLGMMRPYAPAIRAGWTATLVAAGFPAPPGP